MRPFRLFADISSNNASFDAVTYRRAGHRLVAIKATEGTHYINPKHAPWARQAHKQGVRVMHYHFCRPKPSVAPAGEAAAFWRSVQPSFWRGDLLAYDLEVTEGVTWAGLRAYLSHELQTLTRISGHHARLYSGEEFIRSLHPTDIVPGGLCWVARWSPGDPSLPRGLRVWAKQYTNGTEGPKPHAFAGIGRCDGSALNLRSSLRLLLPAK